MNSKKLNAIFNIRKKDFDKYINDIKINIKPDIFTIINTTLISNPGNTNFPKYFFLKKYIYKNIYIYFVNITIRFYIVQTLYFFAYLLSYILYKKFYGNNSIDKHASIAIDVTFLTDNIIKENRYQDPYFVGLYDVLHKYKLPYFFLPRLLGVNKNPFKLIKLFKIFNAMKTPIMFEYELLSLKDFIDLYFLILRYPFKTLRLVQTKKSAENRLFNNELIIDLQHISFETFSRYLYGKNIARNPFLKKIFSWSEFQSIERSFNYGIRKHNDTIKLYGCQFFLNYPSYFNSYVDDTDFEHLSAFHYVLVNGKYFLSEKKLVQYKLGVSLRYQNIFSYEQNQTGSNIILLGSYLETDTKYMLNCMSSFNNVLFKNHPAVNITNLYPIPQHIQIVDKSIYTLFKDANIVISTASGTLIEAVSCGISVILIASQDNFTHNPLANYGKEKIWGIAFTQNDIKVLYNKLLTYRDNNLNEILEIALWYKKNFFVEPNEQNIIKAFALNENIVDFNFSHISQG